MTATQLMSFSYDNLIIHSEVINNEPWFLAKEVCEVLKFTNSRKAVSDHCFSKDVTKRYTLSKGGKQQMIWINEAGLYALIFGSKLPSAEKFKDWVTHEVLPSLRKTGKYQLKETTPEPVAKEEIMKVCEFSHPSFHEHGRPISIQILILEEKILFEMSPVLTALHIARQSPLMRTLDEKEIFSVPFSNGIHQFTNVDNLFRLIFSSRVSWAHEFQKWILYFVFPRLPHTKPFTMHMQQIPLEVKEQYQLEEDKSLKFIDRSLTERPDSIYEQNFQRDLVYIAKKTQTEPMMAGVYAGILIKSLAGDQPRIDRIHRLLEQLIIFMKPSGKDALLKGISAAIDTIKQQDLEPDVYDDEVD